MKFFKFLCILFIVFVVPVTCLAWQSKSVKKANDFISAGMTSKAIETLEIGINEKPKDVDAHWMLGKLYLEREHYSSAEERFNSAVLLKPSYKNKLGNLYKVVGDSSLAKRDINQAISLLTKAGYYDPNVRKSIAQDCFSTGKFYLSPGQSKYADKLFSFARSNDSSIGTAIQEVQVGYGNKMLDIAKGKSKSDRKKYVNEAKKYLSQSKVDKVFPPPYWKTVYEKTFTGVGYTGGDDSDNDGSIFTAEHGKELLAGDRITVIDSDFEVYRGGGWKKHQKYEWIPVTTVKPGAHATFRNKKGVEFTVVVQRYME